MHALTLFTTLAATAAALPAAMPVPAGGPQGPISYPVGTFVQIAVLQPSQNDYLVSGYKITSSENDVYIRTEPHDTTPAINFVTTNATDAAGYTGVAMQDSDYGIQLTDDGILISQGAQMLDWYLHDGALWNVEAPEGFYCEY